MKKRWVLAALFCISTCVSIGQCPDKQQLWRRLQEISSPSVAASNELLKELISFKQSFRSCSDPVDSSYAFLLQRIGATYYRMGDFVKAGEYVQQAAEFNKRHHQHRSINYRHNIRNYYILSVIYDSLQNPVNRNRSVDSCLNIAIRYQSTEPFFLYSLLNRVESLFYAGEYQRAYDLAVLGERSAEQSNSADRDRYQTAFFVWHVNVLSAFHQYAEAEKLLRSKIEDLRRQGNVKDYSSVYQQMGRVQLDKDEVESALLSYRTAADAARKSGYFLLCAQANNNIGYEIFDLRKKQYDSAIRYYQVALKHLRQAEDQPSISFEALNVYANIGNAYSKLARWDSADHYFRLAFGQVSPGIDEQALITGLIAEHAQEKRESANYLVSLVLDKAESWLDRYRQRPNKQDAEKALAVYHAADKLFEKIKQNHFAQRSKLFWSSNARRLYENGIETAAALDKLEDVFYFFERSRAVILNEQLNEYRSLASADIQSSIQLKKKIVRLEKRLRELDSKSEEYRSLQNQVLLDKQELDALASRIKLQNPVYYQGFIDSSFITIEQVRKQLLLQHRALVEFFMGDRNLYVLTITPSSIQLKSMKRSEFEKASTVLTQLLADPVAINQRFREFTSTSSTLFRNLFEENSLPAGRIIVSPDGTYFPLEILVTGLSANKPVYLVQRNAISYTYSARFLLNNFDAEKNSQRIQRDFLGIAPVNFAQNQLPALNGSDKSLQAILPNFEERNTLIRNGATRNNFLEQFADYKVIQLYAHAAGSSSTGEPAIYFYDSTLYLSDLIADKNASTRLIVLSACETASGEFHAGEGIFSFNRGFAALGIPAAVTNLWAVDDHSTYKVTELFYKYLSQGKPPDVALQSAKLEYMAESDKQGELPYYWAAPILTGKSDPIEFTHHFPWGVVISGSAVVIAGVLIYAWRRQKRGARLRRPVSEKSESTPA